MATSYQRLWDKLDELDMKKIDLERSAHVSHFTINKLTKGENITTEVLEKICTTLGCTADEIMEFVPQKKD